MTGKATHKDKVEHPAESYRKPADLVRDEELSLEEKKKALDTWEQDARQLVTASNEGMEGRTRVPARTRTTSSTRCSTPSRSWELGRSPSQRTKFYSFVKGTL
jgi:hypothetical protein